MAKADQSSLATVDDSALTVPSVDPDAWWDEEADDVEGYDLLKDEALFSLVGVPFMIFKLSYRDGIQQKGCGYRNDYVSAELRVSPQKVLVAQRARIRTRRSDERFDLTRDDIPEGGEELVVNDGSTGFYRQCLSYLVINEHVTLPEGELEGGKNESILDLPRSEWLTGANKDEDGNVIVTEFAVHLRCKRGLRFSEYESEFAGPGKKALTWYIA